MWLSCLIVLLAVICMDVRVTKATSARPNMTFYHSRPDILLPELNVHVLNQTLVDSGFIFWTPDHRPVMYDSHGELVWYGSPDGVSYSSSGLHVCDYNGRYGQHLCFFQGQQMGEYAHGMGIILDNSYKVVKTIQAPHGSDMHEFRLVDEDFNITNGVGWLEDSVFRDVDISMGTVSFEWHSVDHIQPVPETTIPLERKGRQNHSPLDYFHINSLDKNADGDYLIGARHMNTVMKVSGQDGHIIWQLSNSDSSSFKVRGIDLFGQHNARWISENTTHTILSLFNNGANGRHNVTTYSAGIIIAIDHQGLTASPIQQYRAPTEDMLAISQGSMQILTPSRNVFIGWGIKPAMTEHLEDGTPVFHASVLGGASYRASKSQWKGLPTNPPDLWVYAKGKSSTSQTAFYVSWNGATEVHTWILYVGASKAGPFETAGSARKQGFETFHTIAGYYAWAYVEGVSDDGSILGQSPVVAAWVPPPALAPICDESACPNAYREVEDDPDVEHNISSNHRVNLEVNHDTSQTTNLNLRTFEQSCRSRQDFRGFMAAAATGIALVSVALVCVRWAMARPERLYIEQCRYTPLSV